MTKRHFYWLTGGCLGLIVFAVAVAYGALTGPPAFVAWVAMPLSGIALGDLLSRRP